MINLVGVNASLDSRGRERYNNGDARDVTGGGSETALNSTQKKNRSEMENKFNFNFINRLKKKLKLCFYRLQKTEEKGQFCHMYLFYF